MARTASKVQDLVSEDESMEDAIEYVLNESKNGPVSWGDVSEELTSGQWGRLIETGILIDSDGDGFRLDDRDAIEDLLTDEEFEFDIAPPPESDTSWSQWDKIAAVGSVAMMAGYMFESVREPLAHGLHVFMGPLLDLVPFFGVVMILALFTGLYSTLLQANLMDMEIMGAYQQRMKDIQARRKEAKESGNDEAMEKIQQEQMEAMADNLGMFKAQFRPMVWIMVLTIPVFLWMYAVVGFRGDALYPELDLATIVLPFLGTVAWDTGIVGPIQTWIVWYFICSMCFTQILRKALNIQTTPT